jgi:hypothetical protein
LVGKIIELDSDLSHSLDITRNKQGLGFKVNKIGVPWSQSRLATIDQVMFLIELSLGSHRLFGTQLLNMAGAEMN